MPPTSNITSFFFEAAIYNSDDTPVASGNYGVQFFNTTTDLWENIVLPVATTNGVYRELVDTANPATEVAEQVAAFLAVVQAGGFPSVRMIRESTATLPEVVSEGAKLRKGATNTEGSVDFGDVWVLETDNKIEQIKAGGQPELDQAIVALPRPATNNKIFKALKAAIKQADLVNNYTEEEIEAFFVSLADGSFVDMVGQISTLEATVAERDATIATHEATIATQTEDIAAKAATITAQTADIAAKEATITTQTEDIAAKAATITTQTADIAAKAATITEQTATIADKDAAIYSKDQEIQTKGNDLVTCKAEGLEREAEIHAQSCTIAEKEAEILTKEAELYNKDALIAQKDTDIMLKQATIDDQAEQIAAKDADIQAKGGIIAGLNTEIAEKDALISTQGEDLLAKTATIEEQTASIAERDATIEQNVATIAERDAKISSLDQEILTKDGEISTLNEEVSALNEQIDLANTAISAETLLSRVVTDVETATQSIEADVSNRYSISNLQLDLKTTALHDTQDGLKFQLVDGFQAREVKDGSVTSITFGVQTTGGTTAIGPGEVPQLTGLTETAVRFKLNSLGLKLEAIYQPVDSSGSRVIGQSFKQSPAPGETIPAEGTVTVIFAKDKDTQN